jgi:hypothetical protein
LLPLPRSNDLPEAVVAPLEGRKGTLWVTVGSALGQPWWYPPRSATFELVDQNMVANDAEVNFGVSPWDHTVDLWYLAAGPEADEMRIMCRMDNAPLVLPPGGMIVFVRHAMTISFGPPFPMPTP